MRPSINPDLVKQKSQIRRNDSAYFIFDKQESLMFSVNLSHVRMKYGKDRDPIFTNSESDYNKVTKSLIEVYGPIIDMVDYFMEGATIQIKSTKDVVEIYERIENHIDAHIKAMLKSKMYRLDEGWDLFGQLAEFALSLYARVKEHRLANRLKLGGPVLESFMTSRPTFMTMGGKDSTTETKTPVDPKIEIPSIVEKYNRLERLYNQNRM